MPAAGTRYYYLSSTQSSRPCGVLLVDTALLQFNNQRQQNRATLLTRLLQEASSGSQGVLLPVSCQWSVDSIVRGCTVMQPHANVATSLPRLGTAKSERLSFLFFLSLFGFFWLIGPCVAEHVCLLLVSASCLYKRTLKVCSSWTLDRVSKVGIAPLRQTISLLLVPTAGLLVLQCCM